MPGYFHFKRTQTSSVFNILLNLSNDHLRLKAIIHFNKEFSKQRQRYYKNLRREQKKKKKKRMKNEMKNKLRAEDEVVELEPRTTCDATNVLPPTTKEGPKRERRLQDSEKHFLLG